MDRGQEKRPTTPQTEGLKEVNHSVRKVDAVQLALGKDEIRTVALCGGAGMDFFFDAVSLGADAYLTGEAKHHELLLAADCGKTLVVGGHFATEAPSMEALRQKVQTAFPALRTVLLDQPYPVQFIAAEGETHGA